MLKNPTLPGQHAGHVLEDAGESTIVDLDRVSKTPRKSGQRCAKTLVDRGVLARTGQSVGSHYRLATRAAVEVSAPSVDPRWQVALDLLDRDGRVTRQTLVLQTGLCDRTRGGQTDRAGAAKLIVPGRPN